MSVEKFRPVYNEGKIVHEKKPFTMILNKVLQSCTNSSLLGLWCYLQSLPENWDISPQHLMNHFSIGKDKCYRLLDLAISCRLLRHDIIRDERGRMVGFNYVVLNGENFENNTETKKYKRKSKPVDNYPLSENQEVDNVHFLKKQKVVKSDTTKKYINNKNKYKSSSSTEVLEKKSPSECPGSLDLVISPEATAIALEKGLDIESVFKAFSSYAKSKALTYVDWTSAFSKWVVNERIERPQNKSNYAVASVNSKPCINDLPKEESEQLKFTGMPQEVRDQYQKLKIMHR